MRPHFPITAKLMTAFIVILLLMVPITIYSADKSKESLQDLAGRNAVTDAQELISSLDINIYMKMHELHQLSVEEALSEDVKASNRNFANLTNASETMANREIEWRSIPTTETSPFMDQLMGTDLAEYTGEKYITHYILDHGYSIWKQIVVTNAHGAVMAMTSRTEGYDHSSGPWWEQARSEGSIVLEPILDPILGKDVLMVATSIRDHDGTFLGVIMGKIDISALTREAQITLRQDREVEYYLISDDGFLIYSSSTFRYQENITDEPYFSGISEDDRYFHGHKGKVDKLYSYAHSGGHLSFPGLGWIMVLELDKDEVNQPASDLREDLFLATYVIVIIGLFIAVILALSFSRPIKAFQSAALEVADGDMKKRVKLRSITRDEITDLSDAFNEMTGKLEESHKHLEDKVEARTVELEKANESLLVEKNFTEDMINSLPGVFYLINPEGRFGRWNRVFEQVSGYSHEEFGQLSPLDLFGEEEKEKVAQRIGEVFEKGESKVEASIVSKDGSSIPHYFTGFRIMFGGLPYLIGVGIDITDLKAAEDRNERLLHAMGQRVKEIKCLFGTLDSIRQRDHLVDILQDIAGLIPNGFQYSDIARARVTYHGQSYESAEFGESEWTLSSGIVVNEIIMGSIEVNYLEERTPEAEGPFLAEERDLLDTIARTVGEAIEGRQAREESILAMSERAAIVDNMAEALIIVGNDLRITGTNTAWTNLFGYAKEEMIGQSLRERLPEVVHGEEVHRVTGMLEALRRGEDPESFATIIAHRNGTHINVAVAIAIVRDVNGDPLYSIINVKDITALKNTERELTVFKRLIERSGQGMGMANFDTTISFMNPTLVGMLGEDSEEAVHEKKFTEYYTPELQRRLAEEIIPTVMREGQWTGESKLRKGDGTLLPTIENFFLIEDENGNPRYIGDVVTDITDLKQAEEKLMQTMSELQRSNKELESFAYVASHDLQEPLRKVKNFSELLAKRYGAQLDEKADRYLNHISSGASRMQDLIQDLLTYSRVSTRGKPFIPCSMDQILEDALENLQYSKERAHAEITHDPLPAIVGDASQLTQVFQNIVGNAIKFRGERAPRIHVSVKETDDEWQISIKDNGIGLEMQYAEKVFVVFQRLHSRGEYDGTGIGLAVCKKIIERHDGRIWVESEIGEGTTFHFTIPRDLEKDDARPDEMMRNE